MRTNRKTLAEPKRTQKLQVKEKNKHLKICVSQISEPHTLQELLNPFSKYMVNPSDMVVTPDIYDPSETPQNTFSSPKHELLRTKKGPKT